MKFDKYPNYKNSEIDWLGTIPSSWELSKLKFVCDFTTGNKDTIDAIENGKYPLFVRSNNIQKIDDYTHDCEAVLTAGDGAIGKIFHYYVGKFSFHQRVYMFHNFRKVTGKYFYYYLYAFFNKILLDGSNKLTVDSLRKHKVGNFPFILPPIDAQNSIVDFLSKEIASIDNLIEKQEKLIQLLDESKKSIIFSAITKGTNSNTNMKKSTIPWIDFIPSHWEIHPVKSLFKINKKIAGIDGLTVLSITQKGIKIKDINSNEGQMAQDYSKYQIVNIGDFAMNHMDLLTGWIDIAQFEGVTSPDYRVFSAKNNNVNTKFYLYLFQMGYLYKIWFAYGRGAAQLGRWRLPTDEFKNLNLPYPPLDEQNEIVSFIENEVSKIDILIKKETELVGKLKELKSLIISNVISGKIDVREAL